MLVPLRIQTTLLVLCLLVMPVGAAADNGSIGLGIGTIAPNDSGNFNIARASFSQPMKTALYRGAHWTVSPRGTVTLGTLSNGSKNATMGTLGPDIVFHRSRPDARWFARTGLHPTLISRHNYDGKGMGGPFQFTSHIGAGRRLGASNTIMLHFQHTSNAGLFSDNKGLDLVILSVQWQL